MTFTIYGGILPIETIKMKAELLKENYFLPEILKSLNEAKSQILASVYFCKYVRKRKTDPARKVINKLIEKSKQGIDVKIIFHIGQIKRQIPGWNLFISQDLRKEGVQARLWKLKRILHSKLFVIDKNIVFLGSHNLSNTSLTESAELSIKYTGEDIGIKAAAVFAEWWKQGV